MTEQKQPVERTWKIAYLPSKVCLHLSISTAESLDYIAY